MARIPEKTEQERLRNEVYVETRQGHHVTGSNKVV